MCMRLSPRTCPVPSPPVPSARRRLGRCSVRVRVPSFPPLMTGWVQSAVHVQYTIALLSAPLSLRVGEWVCECMCIYVRVWEMSVREILIAPPAARLGILYCTVFPYARSIASRWLSWYDSDSESSRVESNAEFAFVFCSVCFCASVSRAYSSILVSCRSVHLLVWSSL